MAYTPVTNPWVNIPLVGDMIDNLQDYLETDLPTEIASAISTAISGSGYAPLSSPTFIGTPAAPTAAAGTNTTQLATTAFVTARAPKLTVAGTKPVSPSDGDEWIYENPFGNNESWRFKWRTSVSRWEFVGGGDGLVNSGTSWSQTTAATYQRFAGSASLNATITYGGSYIVTWSINCTPTTSGANLTAVDGVQGVAASGFTRTATLALNNWAVLAGQSVRTITAGQVLEFYCYTDNPNGLWQYPVMTVKPVYLT